MSQIPDEYVDALLKIKEFVPQVFFEQAGQCASIFAALDRGGDAYGEKEFLMQFRQSFLHFAYMRKYECFCESDILAFISKASQNKEFLPAWIETGLSNSEILHEEEKRFITQQVNEKYLFWLRDYAWKYSYRTEQANGTYYFFDGLHGAALAGNFTLKVYIPYSELHKTDNLENALMELSKEDTHPYAIKDFYTKLVLYFKNSKPLQREHNDKFKKHGLKAIGPVMDEMSYCDDEILYLNSFDNLRSLGDSGWNSCSPSSQKFNPAEFFGAWLNYCFSHARNPATPYYASFIWGPRYIKKQMPPKYNCYGNLFPSISFDGIPLFNSISPS